MVLFRFAGWDEAHDAALAFASKYGFKPLIVVNVDSREKDSERETFLKTVMEAAKNLNQSYRVLVDVSGGISERYFDDTRA